jgi:hypothetical protein|tara:strand:+ start:838 stop:2172 length:1335 start_codon:yes stop_codon:yes gene_type:complete
MALSGFLVPFASGALIKRQEIADEYDETAGEIIDAASEKYNEKLSLNNKAIELQNANYAAVENALGTTVAEAAAKNGFLNNVDTNKVVNYVTESMPKGLVKRLQDLTLTDDKKSFLYTDVDDPKTLKEKKLFDSVFKDDYNRATTELGNQKDWASKNLNKGAIKNVSDLYLSGDEKLPAPTGIEKAQKFLFGDRITKETGATFNLAAEEAIGGNIDVQPKAIKASQSLSERVGYVPPVDIGSVINQDRAIAGILNAKDIKLSPDGSGIIFPARFNNHVLAIKDNAKQYALEYTTDDGKIDVSNLMLRSNEDIVQNIISPISTRFKGYGIDTTEFAKNMSFRVMKATDINFDNTFYTDNNLTEKDFIKAPLTRPGISNTSGDVINGFTISAKAADAFENEITTQNSKQLQAVYIDYLPDNMQILVGGQAMPIKTYYKQLFGIGSF